MNTESKVVAEVNEKIVSIEQITDVLQEEDRMDGYRIVTENHTYEFLIENHQSCCENWGHMVSQGETTQYVGETLLFISDVSLAYDEVEKGETAFIDVYTSLGVLTFTVYNDHNGYYGHVCVYRIDGKTAWEGTL